MSESSFDSRPGTRRNEIVFLGKSPGKVCVRLLLLGLAVAGVASAFAASEEFRTWLRAEPTAARRAAAACGGGATLLFVCAAWIWNIRIRWVAISPEGIRWLRGLRAKRFPWDQFVGLHRGSIEISVWGEELKAGRYADIEFRKGRALRISTQTIQAYEELIAEIQLAAAEAVRKFFLPGGSHVGQSSPGSVAYGPLRLHPDGLQWDGRHYQWDEIGEYEVAVGLLRIQPTEGTRFLRRLTDLGDWAPVVDQLKENVGSRQLGTADAPQV